MIKISVDAPLNIIKHITQFKIVQKYKRFHLKVFNNYNYYRLRTYLPKLIIFYVLTNGKTGFKRNLKSWR